MVDNDLKKSSWLMISHKLNFDLYEQMTETSGNLLIVSISKTIIVDKTGHIVFSKAGKADYSNTALILLFWLF